ncbi:unnamed protein product [Lactuca saligna]|uniref:Uncharacterized protein n=1 Tax=Lactuca saligna TaxID=75948 RepID=A0AA36E4P4_LACSI|nr:unnamed protein product [Lactuca saligna]
MTWQLRRVVIKCCVSDVSILLSDLIEIHDPLIPITVKKHLTNKTRLAFTMINRIEGVLEFSVLSKQGGEHIKGQFAKEPQKTVGTSGETEKPKTMNEPKGNEALDFKGKGKLIDGGDEEEPEEHDLKQKKGS